MIILNFKNYIDTNKVLKFVKQIENQNPIIVAPTLNLKELKQNTKLKIYSQHIDKNQSLKSTGFLLPIQLKQLKLTGTLLNHSEHKISLKELKLTMKECKKLNLKTIVCISNLNELKEIKKLNPTMIAFEEEKLIATKKSITKYNSENVKIFAKQLNKTKIIPLCGAGINKKEDYKEALELGCKGVLISSAIMKSKNPKNKLKEFK